MVVLFLGADGAGRSHTMLNLGKMLSKKSNKVLVVDTTKNQGINSYFEFNYDVEENIEFRIREGMDLCSHVNIDKILSLDFSEYDYVLIEGDKEVDNKIIELCDKIFLIQNFDKDKLIKNMGIIKLLGDYADKATIVFNQVMDSRVDIGYFMYDLIGASTSKVALIQNGQIEIPFSERDCLVSMENKVDGRLRIEEYSKDFKLAVKELMLTVYKEQDSNKKRIV